MTETENAITVTGLYHRYPDRNDDSLRNVSFCVKQGQTVCLIGRNEAGKTTLLKCIAGIQPIQRGTIEIRANGHRTEVRVDSPYIDLEVRKRIGIVFQEPTLWPHMTVLQNIVAPLLDVHRKSIKDAHEDARYWLDWFRIKEAAWNDYPQKLSGGSAQRVAIARALAIKPDILLLDEITSNLDPEITKKLLELLERTFVKSDKTVLMVTHKIELLSRWEPTVGIIDQGELVGFGEASDILEKPSAKVTPILLPAVGPSNAQWVLANQCLGIAGSLSKAIFEHQSNPVKIFQAVATEVSRLISQLEPEESHLVLVTVADSGETGKHRILAACQSDNFILDGRDAVELPREILVGGSRGRITLDAGGIGPEGTIFNSGDAVKGSLIRRVFTREFLLEYQYSRKHPAILGAGNWYVPDMLEDKLKMMHYYEFSRSTRNVYLFAMESLGKIIGVLSVDTTADEKWLPFVVKELKFIAELGAMTIRIARDAARVATA